MAQTSQQGKTPSSFGHSKKFETLFWVGAAGLVIFILCLVSLERDAIFRPWREAVSHPCGENLEKIDGAKQQWAVEQGKKETDVPTWNDLIPAYLKKTPICPMGGTYTIGAVNADPHCSLGQTKQGWFSWKQPNPKDHRLP
jgi:hypothetical protein